MMAFPCSGGVSVIVCQGANLLAIRPRRPPQGDTAAVTQNSWITAVIHDFGGVSHARQNRRPDSPIFAFSKRCVVRGLVENGWWRCALWAVVVSGSGLCWWARELGNGHGGQMWTA